eukprot:CAMPEP_0116090180 /NCGR_PEP_ID=MMETSP0327-20121206/6817_1 /TAXON_ID=44447 /ORGANISM="Pseudo-nitzschia delicatissima, Strain B596" /LENGTH=64 /DNA_ID=CAMNT_0003581413 /DNA_START=940 /DNA_END=1134 /DNA_ORIENTATION=+
MFRPDPQSGKVQLPRWQDSPDRLRFLQREPSLSWEIPATSILRSLVLPGWDRGEMLPLAEAWKR